MSSPDNFYPDYLTVTVLYGVYHVNLMHYDSRSDSYQVFMSKNYGKSKESAEVGVKQWAAQDGLEVR